VAQRAFLHQAEASPAGIYVQPSSPARGDVILIPNCATSCLLRQYGDALRILLENQCGSKAPEVWESTTFQLEKLLGLTGMFRLYEGLLTADILFTLATRLRPYQKDKGRVNQSLAAMLDNLVQAVSEKGKLDVLLCRTTSELMTIPRNGVPGMRPVVGVTGDLYTRINAIGNASLVRRLEQLGCEVWPSPFFAEMADLCAALAARRNVRRGQLKGAAVEEFATFLTQCVRRKMLSGLPRSIKALAVEPPAHELIRLALPFVGSRTDSLIVQCVAKTVDFLRRGAGGVINAVCINCMVGTATASVIPSIRAAFGQSPVITLVYGNSEGPTQRIRLETFVHQVQSRWKSSAA